MMIQETERHRVETGDKKIRNVAKKSPPKNKKIIRNKKI